MQMKVKVIKCSNDKLWYSSLTLPIEFIVKESSNSTYEIIEESPIMASFVKNNQLFKDDCITEREFEMSDIQFQTIVDGETKKFDEGKPDFTLIPQEALLEVAKVFTHGAAKYGRWNYSLGTDYTRYIAAAQRHINQWLRGEDIDEISTNHLSNAIASLMMVLDNQKTGKGIDNRNKVYKKLI